MVHYNIIMFVKSSQYLYVLLDSIFNLITYRVHFDEKVNVFSNHPSNNFRPHNIIMITVFDCWQQRVEQYFSTPLYPCTLL